MKEQYTLTYYVTKEGEGKTEIIKGKIEFSCDPEDYGNGYTMYIETPAEQFGGQAYDIRYDTTFLETPRIAWIVNYFCNRYDGKDRRWKLIGIRVHEAEF